MHATAAALLLAATLLFFWWLNDTPETQIALYAITWLWLVALPGVVLARLLLGRRGSWFTEIMVGITLGMAVSVQLWLLLTWLGVNQAFIAWPVPVLVVSLLPRFRYAWRRREPAPAGPGAVAIWLFTAAVIRVLAGVSRLLFSPSDLPPGRLHWFQDDFWQLALTAQLQHAVPPDLPQVAGTPFWYHWFSNAHIASLAGTGLDLNVLMMRLWMPVVLLAALGMVMVIGKQLTGAYWPGALAALCVANAAAILPVWGELPGLHPSAVHSPSQQFALAVTPLAMSMLVMLLQQRRLSPGHWVVLVLALLGNSGAKGSVLPVLICGMLAVVAMCLLTLRSHLKPALLGLGATAAVLAATMPLTSGGSAGVHVQLFSSFRLHTAWVQMHGRTPTSLDPVLPGLDRAGAPLLLGLLLLGYVIAFGYVWISAPRWRANPSAWLMLGIGVAGWAAMMLVNQDGFSQVYFFLGAVVAWHLMAGVGAHWAWHRSCAAHGRTISIGAAIFGYAVGAALLLNLRQLAPQPEQASEINRTIIPSYALWLLACATVLVVAWLWRTGRAGVWLGFVAGQFGAALPLTRVLYAGNTHPDWLRFAHWAIALAGAAVLVYGLRRRWPNRRWVQRLLIPALALAGALVVAYDGVQSAHIAAARPTTESPTTVTAAETSATLWLRDNSATSDIVATNLHCAVKKTVPDCDTRLFWVGAFTQRRVLLEGWGYTAEAHQAHGTNDLIFSRQPFHDQELFKLNEAAFYAPTPEVLDALRARKVRWLFADKHAGAFSEELADHAELVYENSDVHIYRL
ncbi:hypothetical protein [Enemella sp. A6]|uniref:hypothetical protein n=1 Tax=Enemella sp. A6 TaxID=3440152 RepID=UPI003EBD990D